MAQVTLPHTLTAGAKENVNHVQANDEALRDGVNAIDDDNIGTPLTAPSLATDSVGSAEIVANAVGVSEHFIAPACRVYNSANISVAHNTVQVLTFNSERFDTDTMHSTSSNTGRLTATTAGIYVIQGAVAWADTASADPTRHLIGIRLNGATTIASEEPPRVGTVVTESAFQLTTSTTYSLAATDYVELIAFQTNSGSDARIVSALGNYSPEFSMTWLTKAS